MLTGSTVLYTLVCVTLAVLIFWRKATDQMALFTAFYLLLSGVGAYDMPIALSAQWPILVGFNVALTTLSNSVHDVFFLVFPNGRFTPRWVRWVAAAWVSNLRTRGQRATVQCTEGKQGEQDG